MDKRYAIFDMDGTLVDSMVFWKNILIPNSTPQVVPAVSCFLFGSPCGRIAPPAA